jgi:hypothetical protein
MFFIFSTYISIALTQNNKEIWLANWRSWLFFVITATPPVIYYLMIGTSSKKIYFIRELLMQKYFYRGWFFFIYEVASWPLLLASVAGIVLVKKREARYFVAGLYMAYFVYGIVFNHIIDTFHDYYALQLVPIIALSIGLLTEWIVAYIRRKGIKHNVQIGICLALFVLTVLTLRPVRWNIQKTDLTHRSLLSREVGEIVDNSANTIFLAPSTGNPLIYDAWIAGKSWPRLWSLWTKWKQSKNDAATLIDFRSFTENFSMSADEVQKIFKTEYEPYNPDYFIITDFEQYKLQPALQEFLTKNFPVLKRTDWYEIFDLRQRKTI